MYFFYFWLQKWYFRPRFCAFIVKYFGCAHLCVALCVKQRERERESKWHMERKWNCLLMIVNHCGATTSTENVWWPNKIQSIILNFWLMKHPLAILSTRTQTDIIIIQNNFQINFFQLLGPFDALCFWFYKIWFYSTCKHIIY